MRTKSIVVVPYDAAWPEAFKALRAELCALLGKLAVSIEHVGSTSVPGLAAKPILDLDAVVADGDVEKAIRALAKGGYRHEGDLGIPNREAFSYTGKTHLTAHHLYLCPQSSGELVRHLAFRDYLRTHPDAAAEYGAIKLAAAKAFPENIEGYLAAKGPFIDRVYRELGLAAEQEVRRAQPTDAAAVGAFFTQLWPKHTKEDLEKEFAAALESPEAAVFLYEIGGSAAGAAHCALRSDYVEGTVSSPVGYLEGIYVREPYRGRGIAKKLLSACERFAAEKGCTEFASDCEWTNDESRAFHLAAGFIESNRIVCFTKKIRP